MIENEENKTEMKPETAPETAPVPELPAGPEPEALPDPAQVKAEETEKAQQNAQDARSAAIDEMERASQKALDAMRETGNRKNDEVVEDAEKKLDDIFDQFRTWMKENTQPDRVKAELDKLAKDTAKVLNNTKEKVEEVASSEQFKSTMQSGKEFLVGTGAMISDGFKYGYDKLMEVPELKKAADKAEEGVEKLRHSAVLKNIVEGTEKGLNDFNSTIFNGLRSFFSDSSETQNTEKEDLPDLPDQSSSEKK